MKYLLLIIFLILPMSAFAAWPDNGMRPALAPNLMSNQSRAVLHPAVSGRVGPGHATGPVHALAYQPAVIPAQAKRHGNQPDLKREGAAAADYFRHDVQYYGHNPIPFPYADIDSGFVIPDGYETVNVNGETFYYNEGVFYQQVGDELTAIPAVIGAIVSCIPQDYQIVMVDGAHYLFTGGTYYQRVDQGFMVVQPPMSGQG